MKAFLSDLDNTLIYSYKRQMEPSKVLVETKDGKELSYMTEYSYTKLQEFQKNNMFIPITTRSLEQYERIFLGKDWIPGYALTSNGGILLKDGQIDSEWYEESCNCAKHVEKELCKSEYLLREDEYTSMEVRRVDGLFVFTKSSNPVVSLAMLREYLDLEKVSVFQNGVKVYVLPKELNKGNAIKRIRKYLNIDWITCAGDSLFDIPMLREADEAILPDSLYRTWKKDCRKSIPNSSKKIHAFGEKDGEWFSDYVMQTVSMEKELVL